jgi:ribosome-interacting GTPase 1
MMDWEDVKVQLIDTPPITADFLESYLSSMVRNADAALLMVDLADDDGPFTAQAVLDRLAQAKTILTGRNPEIIDDFSLEYVRTMLVVNKIDADGAADRLEIVREMFGERFPVHVISAEHGSGLEDLRNAIYQFLNMIRVYTKKPGKPADMTSPFTVPEGSTLIELATHVHRDFEEKLKSARVWGAGVFDGQSVPRDHILHDRDVVELHG